MFLKNRSFNVKMVKDGNALDGDPQDRMDGILAAQAYAEVFKDVTHHVAELTITVVLVKTACDLMKIGAKALTR